MWLPTSIFIVGQDPLASALRQSLSLFCKTCYKRHIGEMLNGDGGDDRRKSSVSEIKAQLRPSRLLISMFFDGNPYSEAIRLVHSLRGRAKWNWEGCFIAIVNRREDKEQIEKTNILGQKGQGRVFKDIPGHYVVCNPVMVTDLLRELRGMSELSREVWEGLMKGRVINDIHDKLDKAEMALRAKEIHEARRLIIKVIALLDEVDWLIWLPHSQYRMLGALIEDYWSKPFLTEADCRQVMGKVRQLLVESRLRI